jgi:hypothetical protein
VRARGTHAEIVVAADSDASAACAAGNTRGADAIRGGRAAERRARRTLNLRFWPC